ncbi:MAG: hypothetical protein AAFU70_12570 [Planctomycetota bacterium]
MSERDEAGPTPGRSLTLSVTLTWSDDGQVILTEAWELEGRLHRPGGPALIERSGLTGHLISETWYERGKEHREDGPAVIEYAADDGRSVVLKAWKWKGERHRRGGPAVLEWRRDGSEARREWWIHGRRAKAP